jgi:hypothetical protein
MTTDAEEPDCEDLLLTEGARVCDALRREVLHQADEIERRTAELSTATGEIARLRAALAGAHGEVAKLRSFMPNEAVAVCPSCGGGVVADLDDDWEYITRRHHRSVARDGLSLVLCDGGIAREGTRHVC